MPTSQVTRARIRNMVRGAYALQKLRIATGLRLCANFRNKLGQEAGEQEKDLDAEALALLDSLRLSFNRLTDGIARNRRLPAKHDFKGDEIISDYTELVLVDNYFELDRVERRQFDQFVSVLPDFPIYTHFLKNVVGVGPAMAGVILSEIDITRAKYASSLWRIAGLDVVSHWELDSSTWVRRKIGNGAQQPEIPYEPKVNYLLRAEGTNGPVTVDGREHSVSYYHDPESNTDHGILSIEENGWVLALDYKKVHSGGRSRRREHLVKRTYINKEGKEAERDSITFNPFLKTKLIGVLGPSFLRTRSPYSTLYYEYKNRYQTDPNKGGSGEWTKGHIHNAAIRAMMKQFLSDLYGAWRPLEGLPRYDRYDVVKQGASRHDEGRVAQG
jgi:hypothetical protein